MKVSKSQNTPYYASLLFHFDYKCTGDLYTWKHQYQIKIASCYDSMFCSAQQYVSALSRFLHWSQYPIQDQYPIRHNQ